jgi:hypothetical protein
MRNTFVALLALTGPAAAGCTSGGACVDSAGNVFTISPQGNIQGFSGQTGQQFTGTQFSNGVTIITPAPQGLPQLPLIGVNK